jgi:pilus assembly protein CpaE
MKALVYSSDPTIVDQIAMVGMSRTPAVSAVMAPGELRDLGLHIAVDMPMLVMLDTARMKPGDFDTVEKFNAQFPLATFMLLSADHSSDLLIRSMRAGVREVLSLPFDGVAFGEALDRIGQKSVQTASRNGKVVAFVSCKGGSGATFIATNLGFALGEMTKKKVLLIDFNQQFGDAALYVTDKKPALTLSEVCGQIDRLDAGFLESSLIDVSPHFGILAASDDLSQVVEMQPAHVDTLLNLARKHYDYVVLDIGRKIDAVTVRVLDNTDVIYPVLQLSLPYIRDGKRLLEIFRSLGYGKEKIRLIVNRFERGGKLGLADLQKAVNVDIALTIANNYQAASDSVNQGIPVVQLSRKSSVSKNLQELSTQLVGANRASSKSLFGRMFGRTQLAAG